MRKKRTGDRTKKMAAKCKKIGHEMLGDAASMNGILGRISNILSYVLHPVLLMAATAMVVSIHIRHDIALMFRDTSIFLCGLMPGTALIYLKKRRGDFGHYHLLLIRERSVVLPVLLAGLAGSLGVAAATGTPAGITASMAIALLEGVGVTIISRFWKISLHAAIAMGCASLLVSISWRYALVAGALAVLVGISRLIVRHHTPLQVIAGWIYGFVLTRVLALWFTLY
jgi:membrane-associated phospholipid phosphatase